MSKAEHCIDIYIARHGESVSNVEDIHHGNTVATTERGLEQSERIVDRFAELGVEFILCSTATRTFGSINEAAKKRGIECVGSDLLLEWHRPTITIGKPNRDPLVLNELKIRLEGLGPEYIPQEGAESWGKLELRIESIFTYIEAIARNDSKKRFGVVTHGLTMRFIVARVLLGWFDADLLPHLFRGMHARTGLDNAALLHFWFGNEYGSNARSWSMQLGDTSYLEK